MGTPNSVYILNGDVGSFLVPLCKMNAYRERTARQCGMLVFQTDWPKYECNKLRAKPGIGTSDTTDIQLTEVPVPFRRL